jgi:small subunit ribosomal protein S6
LRTYETVFVLSPELAPDGVSAQAEFYKDNIVKNGGEIITCDEWGKRELAYQIGAFREAYYVLIQFKAEPRYISELERRYKFNELVLRHVVVMIDEKRFKLKPRKDPVKRERRHERKVEEDDLSFDEVMTKAEALAEKSAKEAIAGAAEPIAQPVVESVTVSAELTESSEQAATELDSTEPVLISDAPSTEKES